MGELGHIPGGLVISLRGSVPPFAPEETLAYHANGCGRAIVMFTYVIRIEPGTYAHLEPKCCEKL